MNTLQLIEHLSSRGAPDSVLVTIAEELLTGRTWTKSDKCLIGEKNRFSPNGYGLLKYSKSSCFAAKSQKQLD
jgi:hypothetical protein